MCLHPDSLMVIVNKRKASILAPWELLGLVAIWRNCTDVDECPKLRPMMNPGGADVRREIDDNEMGVGHVIKPMDPERRQQLDEYLAVQRRKREVRKLKRQMKQAATKETAGANSETEGREHRE